MIRSVIIFNNCWLKQAVNLLPCPFRTMSSNVTEAQVDCHSSKIVSQKRMKIKTPQLSESVKEIKNQYPVSFWKRHKQYESLYLVDKDVAGEIASKLCENDKDVYIFELNPGPGVLTKAFLEAGVSRIRIFEEDALFLAALRDLSQSYQSALEIMEKNFLFMSPYISVESAEFKLYLAGIAKKAWNDGIPLKIFLIVYSPESLRFIHNLFGQISRFSSIFSFGRCQIFVLMSDTEYSHINARPKENMSAYSCVTVLSNLFFDVEYVKRYPGTAFLPRMKKSAQKFQYMHFVKLTPKKNLVESTVPVKALPYLYSFIWQNMGKKKYTVIEVMEQWIPDCGLHFIKKGLHVFANFKDLTPFQILEVFKQFISLPDYNTSNFQLSARSFKRRRHSKAKHLP